MMTLEESRAEKDNWFRTDAEAPLDSDDVATFSGLHYYPENPNLRFECVLERDLNPEFIEIETSKQKTRQQKRIGWVNFTINNEKLKLAVYEHEPDLAVVFVPFRDGTTGHETYAGGRYLDPELSKDDKLVLDFNDAYLPWCAYSDRWTCSVPPIENWLTVAIEAGEKTYK